MVDDYRDRLFYHAPLHGSQTRHDWLMFIVTARQSVLSYYTVTVQN